MKGHQLDSITNPQNGKSQFEDLRIQLRSIGSENAGRTSGKNNAARACFADLLRTHTKRQDLRVDAAFPDPARDYLGILGAKVQDNNFGPAKCLAAAHEE